MSSLENVVDNYLSLLGYMRDNFFRPVEQMTKNRLSPAQFHAVSILCHKGSLTMSELAGELKVSKQQLTPLIYRLIDNDLVVRKADVHDRRIVRIEITETGRCTFKDLKSEIKQSLSERLSILSDNELDELERMLFRTQEIMKSVK